MEPEGFIEVNQITDIVSYLKSIDWSERWLHLVGLFHLTVTLLSFLSRNMVNVQIFLFLILLLMVYCSELLNEIAAKNWNRFSKHQYFDSNGLFISVIFSSPILLNCLFLLGRFLYQNFVLMTKVKTAQLRQNQLNRRRNEVQESIDHAKED